MIPAFPEFKKVEVDDRTAVETYTFRYPSYSDFNFTSLWSWDTSEERKISELNGNLVVYFTDYDTNEPFLSFLGSNEIEQTAHTLLAYCESHGLSPSLRLVPEVSVGEPRSVNLSVVEDRDNFDYLYSIPKLVAFAGKEFARKRVILNKFKREHPNVRFEINTLTNPDIQREILVMMDRWVDAKRGGGKEVGGGHERKAIERLCATAEGHPLIVSGLFEAENMLAFSIDEQLSQGNAICHFWRTDTSRGRMYELLIQEKARYLNEHGSLYINQEQDLGVEGLRISKAAYPHEFLKKFVIQTKS